LLPYSSNYTFLARVTSGSDEALAVYKPRKGERPLWDFPPGTLAAREVAAYEVSEAAGWGFVPPTVLRGSAPLGEGSLQLFVEHDPDRHYFVLEDERVEELKSFALFDVVINNADRKSGHVLEDAAGHLWGVDHGVTFHTQPKLRTVIWAYADEPLPDRLRGDLEKLGELLSDGSGLGARLADLLSVEESAATLARVDTLLVEGRFPGPSSDRPLPWPLI
jgi:hypothetical protein